MQSMPDISPGVVLADKYRVEKVLGVGGMGMVVAAHHIALDERVAIKLLLPEMLSNNDAVQRFAREARAAIKIKNEHVVRVMDVSTLPSGAPMMVMEFLDGEDLSQLIERQGPLPLATVAEYVLQACEAIAEAHSLGIVHRDLKPANLFVTRRNDGTQCVKVLDFGISKVTGGGKGFDMTSTQSVMGSPLYMSPEQMASAKHVDGRTDIWALGVILHESLCGKPPFEGESITQLVASVLTTMPPAARTLRPDLPLGVDPVILRCLEKDPNRRWSSVREFADALAPFAPSRAHTSSERIAGYGGATMPISEYTAQRELPSAGWRGTLPLNASPGGTSPPVEAPADELPINKAPKWIVAGVLLVAAGIAVGVGVVAALGAARNHVQVSAGGDPSASASAFLSDAGPAALANPSASQAPSASAASSGTAVASLPPGTTGANKKNAKGQTSASAAPPATGAPPATTTAPPATTEAKPPPPKKKDIDMFDDNH